MQCAEFNEKKVLADGKLHQWTPTERPEDSPCALYCINEANTYVKLAPIMKDGTPCKSATNNVCVSGVCRVSILFTNCAIRVFLPSYCCTIIPQVCPLRYSSSKTMVYRSLAATGCWIRTPWMMSVASAKGMGLNALRLKAILLSLVKTVCMVF